MHFYFIFPYSIDYSYAYVDEWSPQPQGVHGPVPQLD